jgi:protein subunit release factor A
MKKLAEIKADVDPLGVLAAKSAELAEYIGLSDADAAFEAEVTAELIALAKRVDDAEMTAVLDGEYDSHDAILGIHAGAGGTEACDWTSMLLRMYLRWAEQHGYRAEIVDSLDGDEAGLKSATLLIQGRNAYGYLESERGVHRLVRISPFDAAKRRHTSFASVDLTPELEEADKARGRTVRQQDGERHPHHSQGQRHHRRVPDGALAVGQPQPRDEDACRKIGAARTRGARGQARESRRTQERDRMGQSDPVVHAAALYDGERPSH